MLHAAEATGSGGSEGGVRTAGGSGGAEWVGCAGPRWNEAELLQFGSSAPHGADLGLLTGGRGSGHTISWLKRMCLPDPRSDGYANA